MSSEQYRQRSEHVEEILAYLGLKAPRYSDWEVGMTFYATKHKVCEYILLHGGRAPRSHKKMEKYLRIHLRKIHREYRKLYRLSIVARYHVHRTMTPEILAMARALSRSIVAALS